MVATNRVGEEDKKPEVNALRVILAAYQELMTERGMSSVTPVSKVREYLQWHRLPAYWDQIILQVEILQSRSAPDGNE